MAYTGINKSSDYFNTKLYTGTGTFPESISGVGFSPEFIWIKRRNATASHVLSDIIRGTTKTLYTDSTSAELTNNTYGWVSSFDSDGFNVNQSGSSGENVNVSGSTYASWNWKANGTGSANTDGNVASTVSANTTAGFSIVKWSGTTNNKTIGHGLGVVPTMVIAKNAGGSGANWIVWHKSLTSGYYLKLNLTNAQDNANSYFTADPTNSILSLTGNTAMNSSGNDMIAYCFAEKKGYSKFGSYTGNGSSDGTFVYTGFKPAFIMLKNISDNGDNWTIYDNKRDPDNASTQLLFPNGTNAEASGNDMDILSNGFKQRNTSNGNNGNGDTFIYMAFAEAPLVGTNNVPCTAR